VVILTLVLIYSILYCLGAPVNLPLNCTSPVSFGNVALGTASTQVVTCEAIIAITAIDGATVGSNYFEVSNSSLPSGPLKAGTSFSFHVTWNLTTVSVSSSSNASYGNISPGIKSTPLTILTTNGVAGYATLFPISLTGTEVSTNPFLTVTPTTVGKRSYFPSHCSLISTYGIRSQPLDDVLLFFV